MRRTLGILLPAVGLALGMTASPALATTAPKVTTPSVAVADAIAASDFAWVNAQRAASGIAPLQVQDWAAGVAAQHSVDMATQGTIFHNMTGYMDVGHSAMHATYLGENVAMGTDLGYAESALINSAPHRANILDPRFNYVGVGAATDDQGQVYLTEDFAEIAGGAAAAAPAPAPAPAATTPKPAVTTPKPVVTTPKPVATTPKPVVTTPPPTATTPKPAATTPPAPATPATPHPTVAPKATAEAATATEAPTALKLADHTQPANHLAEILYAVLALGGAIFALGLGYEINRLLARKA